MNVKKKQNFIKKQEYPGGTVAMRKYFSENLKYPEIAIKNRVEGKVLVAYTVDFDGHVSDAKILKGISTECDAEAIRLVKGLMVSCFFLLFTTRVGVPFFSVEGTISYL